MGHVIEMGSLVLERRRRLEGSTATACQHQRLTMEEQGEIVRCSDCHAQVSAWWALSMLAEHWEKMNRALDRERTAVQTAKSQNLHLIAARRVESAWRSKTTVPQCPHCNRGILPEDHFGGACISRAIELRRREVEASAGATPA